MTSDSDLKPGDVVVYEPPPGAPVVTEAFMGKLGVVVTVVIDEHWMYATIHWLPSGRGISVLQSNLRRIGHVAV